ncbi:MAG TPA: aldo/keto reductase [Alphaproteobacteria bacterium]|nr:aldo/keto reductase [Alphaproteobacteria bacterium]
MKLRNLGQSGLLVSTVGLGCNNFGWRADLAQTKAIIHKALDVGITLFDTADSYGPSEEFIGETLGPRRADVVLATKFSSPLDQSGMRQGASRRYVMMAVESSLRRLKTDWIDLYQLHWPDPKTPIEETLRALDDLIRQGKIRYIGCSNLSPAQVVEAQWTSRHLGLNAFASTQNEYSMLFRGLERELMPTAEKYGLGILPYFPLANGLLTGRYKPNEPLPKDGRLADAPAFFDPYKAPEKIATAQKLNDFAQRRGHALVELAMSWLASRPAVSSIIAGASRPEQVEQNAQAADWELTAAELAEIDQIAPLST